MLLIGFIWVLLPTLAAMVVRSVIPGRWETHGPTVMLVTATGAFFGGILGGLLYGGIDGYGPPNNNYAILGVVLSIVGGVVAFGAYAADVRRRGAHT